MFDYFDFLYPFYFFNRPVKDMTPYKVIEKDGGLMFVLNTLGVSPEDIDVSVEPGSDPSSQYLEICGKTPSKVSDGEYNVNMRFSIGKPIKAIDWISENGLTFLYVKFEEPVKPNVLINRKANLLESGKDK